ncbi:MAG: hypothetical protein ACR2FU_23525 [Streptosporangiaceae bacterium]
MAQTPSAEHVRTAAFAAPDNAHSPAAYWFWHELPSAGQITAQIGQMLDGGFRSFQIQARLAYPIGEYLDPDYLAACRLAVAEAARRGMTVGIYDEYNWQSGQAGGRTVRGHDELRERHVFWATAPVGRPGRDGAVARCAIDQIASSAADLGPAGLAWQYDGARVAWGDWEVIAAVAYPGGEITDLDQIRDVTGAASIAAGREDGCSVLVAPGQELAGLEGGLVTVFAAARCTTSRVPNYLLPEAARQFVRVGYEPFRKSFGDHFGTTVRYIFFDQPHATFYQWPQRHGNLRSSLPFAPQLPAAVMGRTGQGFGRSLLALLIDVGPRTRALRCGFYQAFTELACESFLGTIAAWCRQHGLALSGHEVLGHVGSWHPGRSFGHWDLRVNFGLDYFGLDAYRDITGVDAQDCVPQLSTKMGDSVARSNGRSGCIVEQYMGRSPDAGDLYAGYWGLTLEELRAQAIRLTLAGARQFLFHGFYQTDGRDGDDAMFTNPRFDFPPGINFEPWWPFHRRFADETARLSEFLDGAAPACDVAVLYPLRTIWAEGPGHSYGDHLEFWASFLALEGFGFHLIDERDLLRAEMRNGRLCLPGRAYRALVLPSVSTLGTLAAGNALRAFAAGGGLLVSSGCAPQYLQNGPDEAIRSEWAAIGAARPAGSHLDGLPPAARARALLAPLLRDHPHATARRAPGSDGQLWQWAGAEGDAAGAVARLALFNDSQDPAQVTIATARPGAGWQEWDPATGGCPSWAEQESAAGPELSLGLAPMELRLLRLRERVRPAAGPAGNEPQRSASLAGPAASAQVPLVSGWTLRVPGLADKPVPVEVNQGWERQGFASYSGVGFYCCEFDRPADGGWRLRLPAVRAAVEVTLNGQPVGGRGWAPFEFALPDDLLRPAGNRLEIAVFSAAGNKYYAGTPYQAAPEASGLLRPPVLVAS